jgi:acyl transferase domain-containing protein
MSSQASAVTSLIKVIMMLREPQVPPQPGAPFNLNRKFPPLSDLNIRIATRLGPLNPSPKGDKKLKALVNSFDASGGNVTLAVQEPPSLTKLVGNKQLEPVGTNWCQIQLTLLPWVGARVG